MIEALVPEIEEIGGYSWDTAPLAWRLRVTARCQRQEVRKDLGTLLQLTLLAPDVVDGIPDGRQLASVALPAVAGAVRGAMVGSTCSIGGLQNLRRQRPQLTTLGGMRTFEKLRALCAARSSLQLGHEALHETGSRFELLDSNELIRLVGLGDVAWAANDGLNTRPLKQPGLGAV